MAFMPYTELKEYFNRMETGGLLDAKLYGTHKRICRYCKHMKWIRMSNIRVVHLGSTLNVRWGFIFSIISTLRAFRKI